MHRPTIKAFTVMEVLIAMAIISIIITSTLLIFKGATRSWKKGESRTRIYQVARSIFDMLSRDISQAVDRHFLSKEIQFFYGEQDKMLFISPMGDNRQLIEISYILEDKTLRRRVDENADGDPETFGYEEALSEDVNNLSFNYLGEGKWQAEWDGLQSEKLPKAVKVTLNVGEMPFEIIIRIETAK